MQYKALLAIFAATGAVVAQRPKDTPICDYYTTALLKDNNATNQYTLLTLLVNTAVIGNYTKPNVGIKVDGILAPGEFNGTKVNLMPYFNGGLASTNRGNKAVAVNFLDDGGAAPLMMNKPANGTDSNQYTLLTHLYQYFGVLLGCSQVGKDGFPAYEGVSSQYTSHKYMNLSPEEIGYFITQVGLAASSFGVTKDDVTAVGESLGKTFGYRCAPPAVVVPSQGAHTQSVCLAETCPLSPNDTCSAYDKSVEPLVANATLAMGLGRAANDSSSTATGSSSSSSTGAMPSQTGTGSSAAASISVIGISCLPAVLAAAAAAAVLALG